MLQKLFFLFYFLFSSFVFCQTDTQIYDKLGILKDVVYEDPEEGKRGLEQLSKAVENSDQDSIRGLYHRVYYNYYVNILDAKKAEESIDNSIKFYKAANHEKGVALSTMNKGNLHLKDGDYKNAVELYHAALKIAQKNKLPKVEGMLNKNLGVAFLEMNRVEEALYYANRALQVFTKMGDKSGIADMTLNLGSIYYDNYNYKQALKYYNKALELSIEIKDSVNIGKIYNNLSGIYYEDKIDTLKAVDFALKALEIKKKTGIQEDIIFQYSNIANLLSNQGRYNEAKKYLDTAYEMAQKNGNREELKEIHEIYSIIYYGLGDYKNAVQNERLYTKYKDSILNEENSKIVEEINTKYKTAEKDNEILSQKSKIFKRNAAVGTLAALLLAGFGYYKNYQHRQKIKFQKEILYQQDLATKAVMEAEDNERKRMASHLHDGIGQQLSAANMNVSVINEFKENDEQFVKILERTKSILSDAITDVRELSHQIMPNLLIKNSLSNALRDLIEKSNSPKLHISLKMDGLSDHLDQKIQVVLYRIIQECIQNTIKHADASEVKISLVQNHQEIFAEIQDNGKGFNPLKVTSRNSGMGLENIRSRIEFMKGKLLIESAEGKGTTVNVNIPLNTQI